MTTQKIEILFTVDATNPVPLYSKYSNEMQAQPAYIELDPAARTLDADYSGEVGNAVPANVWNGKILRYPVPSSIYAASLLDFMQQQLPLFERICEGWNEEWDGNNYVGRLNDDAQAAHDELDGMLRETPPFDYPSDLANVCTVAEWLAEDSLQTLWPEGKTLVQALADLWEAVQTQDDCHLTDATQDAVRAAVLDRVMDNRGDLPAYMRTDLLALDDEQLDEDDFEDAE